MRESLPISNRDSGNRVRSSNGAMHQVAGLSAAVRHGKWLPAILVSLHYFNLWKPPNLWFEGEKWYMLFGVAVVVFVIQKGHLDIESTRIFWTVQGLSVLGAIISLPRALYLDSALWGTVGMIMGFATILMFIPTLSTRLARRVMLFALVAASVLWVIEVQVRLDELGVFVPYHVFSEPEHDKNLISLCMALGATALLSFLVLWKPPESWRPLQIFIVRLVLAIGGFYMIYTLSLIYSRAGLLTAFVGVLAVLGVLLVRGRGIRGVFHVGLATSLVVVVVILSLDAVLSAAPGWDYMLEPLLNIQDSAAIALRRVFIEKALAMIRENPFLGVGAGGTKSAYSSVYEDSIRGLIHNSYLTAWAELGILGLLSQVAWIYAYFKMLKTEFFHLPLVDQIWLLLFIPFFFDLGFINIGSQSVMMLALLSGLYYELRLKRLRSV